MSGPSKTDKGSLFNDLAWIGILLLALIIWTVAGVIGAFVLAGLYGN